MAVTWSGAALSGWCVVTVSLSGPVVWGRVYETGALPNLWIKVILTAKGCGAVI